MTACINCEGWGCAQCAHEREAARGGEQGPTALELQVEHLRSEVKRCRDGQARITAQRDEARAKLDTACMNYVAAIAREQARADGFRAALEALVSAVSAQLARGEDTEPGDFERAWKAATALLAATPRPGWDANGSEVTP